MDPQSSPASSSDDLFHAALTLPRADRAAFLAKACEGDPRRREQLEERLRQHAPPGGRGEADRAAGKPGELGVGGTVILPIRPSFVSEKPGDRVGNYKLLQQIGEGGCGVVYMAEQEQPVRRRVALKIIKLGMDTKSVIARFEAERQALAMMDHPNIAKVYDAGITDGGRSFFVMELVRGIPITDYCDQNHLRTAERLALFVKACQAIQHAHQKGIIHRDIKPSNILVTLHDSVPVPKVIDFGIAKAIEGRLTDKTLFTEFQSFIGTPAYMSPEQAEMSGLDIDTRSDIYSLGVLLYEMLTGTTPFDASDLVRSGVEGCRRTIREVEPMRPSNRLATMVDADLTTTAKRRQVEPPRLIHSLRGDLDWVVMKALEKDRTRRYATANSLATDVQRHLSGDTVEARPPSTMYRLQKLFRRHLVLVTAASAITLILIAATTVSTWQAVRAIRAEHAAQSDRIKEASERARAERESLAARLNEYVADINLAQKSLADGNYGRAVQLLEKHDPVGDNPDLRGFEWRYLWHLTRGDAHVSFPVQEKPVQTVAVSPDGKWLVVGTEDKVTIWSVDDRILRRSLPRGASSLAFLPDGKTLVAADVRTVRVFNTENWQEITALPGSSGPLVVAANAPRLAAPTREGVRVWDTTTWNELALIRGATAPFALSPDGQWLTTDARDGAGLSVRSLEGQGAPLFLEDSTNLFVRTRFFRNDGVLGWSPDAKYVIAAQNTLSEHGVFILVIWDATTGKQVGTVPNDPDHIEHTGGITSIVFAPDGKTFATASRDYSIRIWDFATRQRVATLRGNLNEVWTIAFTPDGNSLVSGSRDGAVNLWPTRPKVAGDEVPGIRLPLAVSSDGTRLAALSRDNAVVFLNLVTDPPEEEFRIEGSAESPGRSSRPGPPPSVTISTNLQILLMGGRENEARLWNVETKESRPLPLEGRSVGSLSLSPDGRTVVGGSWEGGLRWWDLRSGAHTDVEGNPGRAAYSPDSRTVAILGRESGVALWDVATRTLKTNLLVGSGADFGPPAHASFSPDGRLIAVSSQDDTVRIFNVGTGAPVGTLIGHKQAVTTVAFSPDGRTIATASDDSTLKLWNAATQQELLTIRKLGGALRGLTFSPDGRVLVAGSSSTVRGGGLRIFRAPTFKEIEAAK